MKEQLRVAEEVAAARDQEDDDAEDEDDEDYEPYDVRKEFEQCVQPKAFLAALHLLPRFSHPSAVNWRTLKCKFSHFGVHLFTAAMRAYRTAMCRQCPL